MMMELLSIKLEPTPLLPWWNQRWRFIQFLWTKVTHSPLTLIGQYYLPPYNECTVDFLRDIFAGRKKVTYVEFISHRFSWV